MHLCYSNFPLELDGSPNNYCLLIPKGSDGVGDERTSESLPESPPLCSLLVRVLKLAHDLRIVLAELVQDPSSLFFYLRQGFLVKPTDYLSLINLRQLFHGLKSLDSCEDVLLGLLQDLVLRLVLLVNAILQFLLVLFELIDTFLAKSDAVLACGRVRRKINVIGFCHGFVVYKLVWIHAAGVRSSFILNFAGCSTSLQCFGMSAFLGVYLMLRCILRGCYQCCRGKEKEERALETSLRSR